MIRLLSVLLLLLLLTACSRYTIGAENAAPRVVSGAEGVEYGSVWDTEQANDHAAQEDHTSTADHSAETDHSAEADHATEGTHADTDAHSAPLPEVDNAMTVVREAFTHVRGSRAARQAAAESLEFARQSVYALYEAGTISHGSELDEYFEMAIEKVNEGTNDAPNALNNLLGKLEKAGKH